MARLIIDTSGYLVSAIQTHSLHAAIREALVSADESPVVPPLIVAEIDT